MRRDLAGEEPSASVIQGSRSCLHTPSHDFHTPKREESHVSAASPGSELCGLSLPCLRLLIPPCMKYIQLSRLSCSFKGVKSAGSYEMPIFSLVNDDSPPEGG